MVDVGSADNWVDTQQARLTNTTDGLTYIQMTDSIQDIDSNVTRHELTDDTVDNVFSLYMNSIEGNMWVTQPQVAALITLTQDVAGVRPKRIWTLELTDNSNNVITIAFVAQLKIFRIIRNNLGNVKVFIKLIANQTVSVA